MLNLNNGIYPEIQDPTFYKRIINKKEFLDNKRNEIGNIGKLTNYQRIVKNFLNKDTYYNSLLVYASIGAGKTLISISVAENFKKDYKIIVCLKNETLVNSYLNEMKTFGINPQGYSFLTYNDLISQIIGNRIYHIGLKETEVGYRKSSTKTFKLDNTLLIIDEAHNITDIKLYDILLDLLSKSIDTKLLLLTGTPVYDNITEIFQLNNLLNLGKINQLPILENVLLQKGFIVKSSKIDTGMLSDTSNNLTNLGKDTLTKTLKGKVSYFKIEQNNKNYAETKYIGKDYLGKPLNETLKSHSSSDKTKVSIKLAISIMSDFQSSVYLGTLKMVPNTLFNKSTDASTIVFPDKTFGVEGFLNNKKNTLFLKKENIEKYSSKLFKLINCIDTLKGSAFIYSNFVNNRGTDLIRLFLLKNGYHEYRAGNNLKNSFVILKGSISSKTLNRYLNTFNSPENKNGDIIKIVIGSPIVNEGITLKNIRQIHILEPTWNFSKIDQIVGRGIRYLGHSDLKPEERNVSIFLHCCLVKNNPKISIDYLKYQLAYKKDIAIKQIEHLLRGLSIDCALNKLSFANNLDYSRECMYTKCDYTCPAEISGKPDTSTYFIKKNNIEEYNYIFSRIIKLFSIGNIYDLKHIQTFVNFGLSKKLETDNIKFVVYEMIKGKIIINNKLLNHSGNFITLKDIEKEKIVVKVPVRYKKVKNVIPKKVSIPKLLEEVYGNITNGIFRINVKTNNVKTINVDARTKTNGKSCTSYSKNELFSICNKIGISFEPSYTKEKLCKIIHKNLKERNLIV
jgi:superfamily II DNA or RNA helicase